MPFNGSGTFVALAPPTFPAVSGQTISAAYFNNLINDLINNGLTLVLCRDGQGAMTGPLNMGTNKINNLVDGVVPTDAATFGQLSAYLPLSGGAIAGNLTISGTLGVTGAATFGAVTITSGTATALTITTLSGTTATFSGAVNAASLALSGNATVGGTLTVTGNTTLGTTVLGGSSTINTFLIGYRGVPSSGTSGTATINDVGRCIPITAGLTIPAATFSGGDSFSIYNNSAGSLTITQGGGLTLRLGGTATTGSRTLAARGLCSVWFLSASEAILTGAGAS